MKKGPEVDFIDYFAQIKAGRANKKSIQEHAAIFAHDLKQQQLALLRQVEDGDLLKDYAKDFPNKANYPLSKMAAFGSKISDMIASDILTCHSEKEMEQVVLFYALAAQEAIKAKDFQSAQQILAGFTIGAVDRLNINFKSSAAIIGEVSAALDNRKNYENYNALLNSATKDETVVPMLTVIQRNLAGLAGAQGLADGGNIENQMKPFEEMQSYVRRANPEPQRSNLLSKLEQPKITSDVAWFSGDTEQPRPDTTDGRSRAIRATGDNSKINFGSDQAKQSNQAVDGYLQQQRAQQAQQKEPVQIANAEPNNPIARILSGRDENNSKMTTAQYAELAANVYKQVTPSQVIDGISAAIAHNPKDTAAILHNARLFINESIKAGENQAHFKELTDYLTAKNPPIAEINPNSLVGKFVALTTVRDADPPEVKDAKSRIVKEARDAAPARGNQPRQIGSFAPFKHENPIQQILSGWAQNKPDEMSAENYSSFAAKIYSKFTPMQVMDSIADMIAKNPNDAANILHNAALFIKESIKADPNQQRFKALNDYLTSNPLPAANTIPPDSLISKFVALTTAKTEDRREVQEAKQALAIAARSAGKSVKAVNLKPDRILSEENAKHLTNAEDYITQQLTKRAVKFSDKGFSEQAKKMAHDLTIHAMAQMVKINPTELYNQVWSKEKSEHKSENLNALISDFNRIKEMVCSDIVRANNPEHQQNVYNFYIKVFNECVANKDLNTAMAIHSAFESTPLSRLKVLARNAQKAGGAEYQQFLENREIFSTDNNFKNLRTAEKSAIIPVAATFTKDLTFAEDGNPETITAANGVEHQNLEREAILGTAITNFQSKQELARAALQNNPAFHSDIGRRLRQIHLTDNEAYKASLNTNPRPMEGQPAPKPFAGITEQSQKDYFAESLNNQLAAREAAIQPKIKALADVVQAFSNSDPTSPNYKDAGEFVQIGINQLIKAKNALQEAINTLDPDAEQLAKYGKIMGAVQAEINNANRALANAAPQLNVDPGPTRKRANTLDGVALMEPIERLANNKDKEEENEIPLRVRRPRKEPIGDDLGPNDKGKGRADPQAGDPDDVVALRTNQEDEAKENYIDEVYQALVEAGEINPEAHAEPSPPPLPPRESVPDQFRDNNNKERRIRLKDNSAEKQVLLQAFNVAGFEHKPAVSETLRIQKIRGLSDSDYVERRSKYCGIHPQNPNDASDIKNALTEAGIAFEVKQDKKRGSYIRIDSEKLSGKDGQTLGAKMRELREQRIAPPVVPPVAPPSAPPPLPEKPHVHTPERQMLQKALKTAFRHAPYVHDTQDGIHCAFNKRDQTSIAAIKEALDKAGIRFTTRETNQHGIQFRIRHSELKNKPEGYAEELGELIKATRHQHQVAPRSLNQEDQAAQKAIEKAAAANQRAAAAEQKAVGLEKKAVEAEKKAVEAEKKAEHAKVETAAAKTIADLFGSAKPTSNGPTHPAGTLSSMLKSAPLPSSIEVGNNGMGERRRAVVQRTAQADMPKASAPKEKTVDPLITQRNVNINRARGFWQEIDKQSKQSTESAPTQKPGKK
ncbi:MAG: RasGEF domain-containing protein [Candidatus Berkiella sp.]